MQPFQTLRDTGSNISLGLPEPGERRERNESPLQRLGSSRERNATGPHAQQVDQPASASVRPSAKPSTSLPPLNRPSASVSPLPPLAVPALSKPTSNRVHTARGTPSDGSQARPGGAPLELPHHRGEERGKALPDEQSRMNRTAPLPTLPDEHVAIAPEPLSHSVSAPRRLDKSNSRTTEGPTSEQKGATAPEQYETRDSTTTSDSAKRRKAGLNLPTSYNSKGIQDSNASVEGTYSSNPNHGKVSSTLDLSEMGKSRGKVGQPSTLDIKETRFSPPESVSTQSRPKHVTGVPSKSDAIVSSVGPQSHLGRPPNVGNLQIESTSSSESPSFLTSLRPTSDSLILSLSQVSPTVAGSLIDQGGHASHESFQYQTPPGFLTKTEQREENAMAALEGRYHSEPFLPTPLEFNHPRGYSVAHTS